MNKIITKLCAVFLILVFVASCSSNKSDIKVDSQANSIKPDNYMPENNDKQTPVEELYREAATSLANEKFIEAAEKFDTVEREYPYSQWATKSQLMSAYSHYRDLQYDEAIIALDRFTQLHPSDVNVPYASYLRALCYYEQISDVRRDQRMTQLALDSLEQVTQRFPNSKYARDAQLKKDLTMDHLAGKEMEIGRYYLLHHQYQAAANRFQRVTNDYQTTTHVPEALHRLVETYLSLGIIVEAQKSAAVLGHNFPNSIWYKDSYRLLKGDFKSSTKPEKKTLYDRTIGKIF